MSYLLLTALIVSFLITLWGLPQWMKKAKQIGLVWEDMNVYGHPKNVLGSGGVVVTTAFIIGVLSYVALRTFVLNINGITTSIFALLTMVTIAGGIGFIDDILGWMKGGLSMKVRILMVLFAGVPLMVINAGNSIINIPFIGAVSIGIIYPLVFIPMGVVGAVTTYNFLAGFKGLESGQGIIILSFLSLVAYLTGSSWLALIGLIMVVSLIVFYFFNIAGKIFPGDSLTYSVGALIAGMAILGNFEKIALFVFIPYILEVILKLRGKLKKYSFGSPQKDGSLEEPYDKIYGLEHLAIRVVRKLKGKAYERDVPYVIFSLQIIICLLALWIFRFSLF